MGTKRKDVFHNDTSLNINRMDYKEFKDNMVPHSHDFLTISLLLSGSLIEQTSKGTTIVKPGSILIKPAQLEHSDVFTENCTILSLSIYDWEHYKLDFNDWKIIPQNKLLKNFLNIIQDKNKKQGLLNLKSDINYILDKKKRRKNIPEWIKEVKAIIDLNFQETLKINDLAKEFKVHPVHLGRVFKDCYHTDIKSYQKQLRLHFSVSEMINKNGNLTKIAHTSGYSDQSHFSRELKKHTSLSPKKISQLLNV